MTASLRERAVGSLQWAVTAAYVFLLGYLGVAWYLHLTRTALSRPLDLSWPFAAFVLGAAIAGYLWVGWLSPAPEAHGRRIEVVVTLLVLGFLFPFGVSRLLDLSGVAQFPPVGFGVGYLLTLVCSYGLVYGLGVRFFLGPNRSNRPDVRE